MLPTPRIIAIDDDAAHLEGLVKALNENGVGCLSYKFNGDTSLVSACPDVRVIFADLHLSDSGVGDADKQHFSLIGGLLGENFIPLGFYCIVLWTRYPEKAEGLRNFLNERMVGKIPPPFTVVPLNKMDFLNPDGSVGKVKELVLAIKDIAAKQPQLTALLNWEEKVLSAASTTVFSILKLVASKKESGDIAAELGRVLGQLAIGSVGATHVEENRFHAINSALLPILADRISNLSTSKDDAAIWKGAFPDTNSSGGLVESEAARLNSLLHIEIAGTSNPSTRGAVSIIPDLTPEKLQEISGMDFKEAAVNEFKCSGYSEGSSDFRWVIVQTQAACDFAQNNPGVLPFYLGLEMPPDKKTGGTMPASIWPCPVFELKGSTKLLHVSARFPITLTKDDLSKATICYRLRDQLVNNLTYAMHNYASRPGTISFRESPASAKKK